ncbi:hypothetical protein BH09SUM1_BH09SUM1_30600 [soil metagenome]
MTDQATQSPDTQFTTPAVDIYEQSQSLVIVADLPGLDREAVTVSVEKDVLTIKGAAAKNEARDFHYREFEPVSFQRQFKLGSKINQEAINADYKHGVLRVTLPFAEEQKPRTIDVRLN